MNRFWDRVSVVGSLLLSLPVLAGAAGVARADGIRIGGVDFSSPAGVAAFTQQVDQAANVLCRHDLQTGTRISRLDACKQDIWDEAMEKLSDQQRAAFKANEKVNLAAAATAAKAPTSR